MGHGASSESAHHRGKTGVHTEFIYQVGSITFSTEMFWFLMKAKLDLMLPVDIRAESSSPDMVQVNGLSCVPNYLNKIWRKKKSFSST